MAFLDTFFPAQDPSRHKAVLGTAFLTLAVFVVLYVLVYVECLVGRWLWASALLTWACLVTLGYVLVFDAWTNAACAWEQVTPASLGADAASRPCPIWASGPPFGVRDAAPAHSVAVGLRLGVAPGCSCPAGSLGCLAVGSAAQAGRKA